MVLLKIILATWMAVFLALPTCPCQLFEPLGIDFPHKHEVGSQSEGNSDYTGILEMSAPTGMGDEDLPVCHCEEGLGKTAEQYGQETISSPEMVFAATKPYIANLDPGLHATCASVRAPPPDRLGNHLLNRAQTGVYRL